MARQKNVTVLSIDGGGVRGYIPALILAEIEKLTGKAIGELFDLVVGTSTGGIIAVGLSAGIPARALAEFYPKYGARIFGDRDVPEWQRRLFGSGTSFVDKLGGAARTVGAPVGGNKHFGGNARHRADGIDGVLLEVLGDTRLSQASMDVALTTFDRLSNVPVVFSRRDAQARPSRDLLLRTAARATSAAPTYFPPCNMEWAGTSRSFVDGGVWANNPAGVAIAESLAITNERGLSGRSVFLVSIGTGVGSSGATFSDTASWIGAAGDLMRLATSVGAGELLARRSLPASQYVRLQVHDDRIAGAMDNASSQRLSLLESATLELLQSRAADMTALIDGLGA